MVDDVDYETMPVGPTEDDAPTFRYNTKGKRAPKKPPTVWLNDHEFTGVVYVPGKHLMEMSMSGGSVLVWFESFLDPKEYGRFIKVLDDPAEEVDRDVIIKIFQDLFAHYTGRPTVPPSNSQDGRRSTPTTSEENSSSPESTPTPSPSGTS